MYPTVLCACWALLLLGLAVSSAGRYTTAAPTTLSPVVFIPGHGGNQMELRVDMAEPTIPRCPTKTKGWIRDWIDLWQFLPAHLKCWVEFNKMTYNPVTHTYHNVDGVELRIPGWGYTNTIEYLDPSLAAYLLGNIGSYAAPLMKEMKTWGYESGKNLRGAPYDFRYGAPSVPHFYDRLKDLIEDSYMTNGHTKVTIMTHSMGGTLAHYFLVRQSDGWKKKYIQSLITLNAPWKGSIISLNALISGYTWGHESLHPVLFRKVQRSCESGITMLPSATEWGEKEVLVITPQRNYTAADYFELFDDMDYPIAKDRYTQMLTEVKGHVKHPGVDTFCLYSSGLDTPDVLKYGAGEFPDAEPDWIMGDGDGTVNLRSAKACRQWRDTEDNAVVTKEFKSTSHAGILESTELFKFLQEVMTENM